MQVQIHWGKERETIPNLMSKKAFGDEERKKWELASKSTKERMKDDSNQNEWNEAKRSVCVWERERDRKKKVWKWQSTIVYKICFSLKVRSSTFLWETIFTFLQFLSPNFYATMYSFSMFLLGIWVVVTTEFHHTQYLAVLAGIRETDHIEKLTLSSFLSIVIGRKMLSRQCLKTSVES